MASDRLIIIIDPLKGFLEPGYPLYCGEESRKIIPAIMQYIKEEKCPVVIVGDTHEPEDIELRLFGKHCMSGTMEAEVVNELDEVFVTAFFEKDTYSAWANPEFTRFMMSEVGTDTMLIFMGVCTDICVFHTIAGAFFHGFEKLVIPERCVASFNKQAHDTALQWMKSQFGVLVE